MQQRVCLTPPVINQPNKMHHLESSSTNPRMINRRINSSYLRSVISYLCSRVCSRRFSSRPILFTLWTSHTSNDELEHVQAIRATCGDRIVRCLKQTAVVLPAMTSDGKWCLAMSSDVHCTLYSDTQRCCWAIPKTKTLNSFAYLEHQLLLSECRSNCISVVCLRENLLDLCIY